MRRIPAPLARPLGEYSDSAQRVLLYLRESEGGLTRGQLSYWTRLSDRSVRHAVEELRRAGEPVHADSKGAGYEYVVDPDRIEAMAGEMQRRAESIIEVAATLRRTAMRLRAEPAVQLRIIG